ncbi:MAG: hypothetical protein AAB373_00345 [Patescibacteria group bacterium]
MSAEGGKSDVLPVLDQPTHLETRSNGFRMPGRIASLIAALVAACSNPQPRGDEEFCSHIGPESNDLTMIRLSRTQFDLSHDYKEHNPVEVIWEDTEGKILHEEMRVLSHDDPDSLDLSFVVQDIVGSIKIINLLNNDIRDCEVTKWRPLPEMPKGIPKRINR